MSSATRVVDAPRNPLRPELPAHLAALFIALLLGLQPLTTDLYLPALPTLTRELAAPMHLAQMTMAALMLSFGVAQLVWGPLADRFGRRPVLLTGLSLYLLASVGGVLAPNIEALIVARVVQGAAMAAAVVCARAMVRDLYEPHEGAHVMSRGLSGLGVIAIASPTLGGLVAHWLGWRGALAVVAIVGAITLWAVWRKLPETLAQRNPRATQLRALAPAWWHILRNPTFFTWTALIAATYGGLFTLLSASSFVYIEVLGLNPGLFGVVLGSASVSYLIGTVVCRRWLLRFGMAGAVGRGALFTLAGGAVMGGFALAGVQSLWAMLIGHWLFCFGHGIHQPCGQAGAVGPFPQAAGAAAALAGFMLAFVAFFVGQWLGVSLDGTVRPMALCLGFWALVTSGIAWTLVQRHALPRVATA
ncbi:MAG TPA: Bcr/CflA family efflux MFS transporter [Burkholderiaceae bacterium]|jgi:DHA1 family bicyclomycin/chloramphenicol resistance-like MFS transporter|nr:Bcr/CflA family efflux MFS transporter [Burkholderiaceae bacterium]